MIAEMRAAVLYEPGRPLQIEEVQLAPPRAGEVRVRVAAAGVCHSDYHYMSGELTAVQLPMVLGHEGAGVVEEVGPGVTSVRSGDRVVLLWRTSCGRCEHCVSGRPVLCSVGAEARGSGHLPDGSSRLRGGDQELRHFLGVSCFAEQTVCAEQAGSLKEALSSERIECTRAARKPRIRATAAASPLAPSASAIRLLIDRSMRPLICVQGPRATAVRPPSACR